MSKDHMYIRFGVHKDRDTLKAARDNFCGIVIPANILSHTSDATRAAVDYIGRKFFIDPMTYILTSENMERYLTKDKQTSAVKFKVSIEKMTQDYGLLETFADRDYKPLTSEDFDDNFVTEFATKSLEFQRHKLNGQAESAYKKYSAILAKYDPEAFKEIDHKPIFITPPYFYFGKRNDDWHKVNLKLAQKTLELKDEDEQVRPIILTNARNLDESLLDDYTQFEEVIVWITDLDESKTTLDERHIEKLKKYRSFVESAKEKNIKVMNLYGSYFSGMLTKLGLDAFSNGIFYGEYKSHISSVGGGAPPARFYISCLHKFYLVPVALSIIQDDPAIFDFEPDKSKKMLKDSYESIAAMLSDQTLAQRHFLYARSQEIHNLQAGLSEVITSLKINYEQHGQYEDQIQKEKPLHLLAWYEVLKDLEEDTPPIP